MGHAYPEVPTGAGRGQGQPVLLRHPQHRGGGARPSRARGTRVRYLNIGDPVAFGFRTPDHLIEAATKAMRDGHNGYLPSAGILAAREAVAADYAARGVPVSPDRVLITTGTSEGIELALNALVDDGDEVLVPSPTYPLYTAILAKIGATPHYYRTDPDRDWLPDLDHLRSLDHRAHPGAGRHRSEQSDRRGLPAVGAPRADRDRRAARADDPRRRGLRRPRLRRPGAAARHARPRRADHLVLQPVEGVSRARLARPAGWSSARTPRLDDALAAIKKLADGAAVQPGSDAIRGRRGAHRRPLAPAVVPRRARRARHASPPRCSTRFRGCAASRRAPPSTRCRRSTLPPGRTDEEYVLGAAARDRHPVRARLRLRRGARAGLLPHRVPGRTPAS